jgi:hypothetical protein
MTWLIAAIVLRRLLPRFDRASLCCNRRYRTVSPTVANCRSYKSPSEVTAATLTPRSIPTAVFAMACCSGVTAWSSTRMETNQCPDFFDTMAERISPLGERDQRKRTQPSFGTFARPQFTAEPLDRDLLGIGEAQRRSPAGPRPPANLEDAVAPYRRGRHP